MDVYRAVPEAGRSVFSTGISAGWRGIFGSYNVFSGIIGGAVLSFASHGTDHLIVQRILACRDLAAARKAMIWSGIIVFFQFGLFLTWGLFIYVLMGGKKFDLPDTIMPYFITHHLPAGMKGLMLAGIFAAAMSTISSSINSISSSTVMDILRLPEKNISGRRKLMISRCVSFVWSCVMMAGAMLLQNTRSPLVELGLSIASITYGGMLGIFMQGTLFEKFNDRAALAGVAASIAVVLAVFLGCDVFWPWFVPIGFCVSFLTGSALNMAMKV
jgi:Na+/proline symporter